jgi:hypothetical protein
MDFNTAVALYNKDLLTFLFLSRVLIYSSPGGWTRTRGGKRRFLAPVVIYGTLCASRRTFCSLCRVCKRWRQICYTYPIINDLMDAYDYRMWMGEWQGDLTLTWLKKNQFKVPTFWNRCGPALKYDHALGIVTVYIVKRTKVGCRSYSYLNCAIRLNEPWNYGDGQYKGYVGSMASNTIYNVARLQRFWMSQPLLANLMLECIAELKKKIKNE